MKQLCIAAFSMALLAGCASSKSGVTNPDAPKESYAFSGKQSEKYLSTIGIPFEITMSDVARQINSNIKESIYEDNSMEDNNMDNFMCKILKRENIEVTAQNETFFFKVPLKVWVKVGYKVMGMQIPPQELAFDFNVKFGTKFAVSPTWEATVQSFPIGYEWIKKPVVRLAGIDIPITPLIEKALVSQQNTFLKALDDAVKKNVEVKKYIVQAWNTASQPYLLSDKYRTWLKVTPTELQMTPLSTANNKVSSTIAIKAYTETITGNKPAVQQVANVPNLKIISEIPDDFQVGVVAEIPFTEASKLTADTLVGQKFTFKDGKYVVNVTDISVYGSEEKLIIKAGLSGSINGTIYFKGVPTYSPQTQSIFLANFDYDLETKNLLYKTANWIFQGKFTKTMQEALTFKIGGQVTDMKKQIQANLNKTVSKGVAMNGNISEITPDRVYLTPTSIVAVVFAKGKLNIKVDGL